MPDFQIVADGSILQIKEYICVCHILTQPRGKYDECINLKEKLYISVSFSIDNPSNCNKAV